MKRSFLALIVVILSVFVLVLCSCEAEPPTNGIDGKDGQDGKDGVGIVSIEKTSTQGLVDTYTITMTDGTTSVFTVNNGANGQDGAQGEQGVQGEQGIQGEAGKNGISITNAEVNENGELVLEFSEGEPINLGKVVGAKGEKGDTGADGTDGADGKDGQNGTNGVDGKDGVSITGATINAQNELVLSFSNGNEVNLGNVKGAKGDKGEAGANGENGIDGQDGVSITGASINDKGELVITFSEGNPVNLGTVVGAKGDKGDTGAQGPQGEQGIQGEQGTQGEAGRGILRTEFVGTDFIIYYTDGTIETHDLSEIVGNPNDKKILVYSLLSDGTYGVMAGGMAKYEAVIEIPAVYEGVAVTQILSEGFREHTSLQEIIIPEGVTKIGQKAFYGCIGLCSAELPSTTTTIDKYAFYNCSSLTEAVIPANVTKIGAYAYYGSAITSAIFENAIGWSITDSSAIYVGISNTSTAAATSSITEAIKTNMNFNDSSLKIGSYKCWYDSKLVSKSNPALNASALKKNTLVSIYYEGYQVSIMTDVAVAYYKSDWVRTE